MDIHHYKILAETYREALQDCLDISHAAINGKAWDRFKVARAVYEITNEVLDEEPEKKKCPMCGDTAGGE